MLQNLVMLACLVEKQKYISTKKESSNQISHFQAFEILVTTSWCFLPTLTNLQFLTYTHGKKLSEVLILPSFILQN